MDPNSATPLGPAGPNDPLTGDGIAKEEDGLIVIDETIPVPLQPQPLRTPPRKPFTFIAGRKIGLLIWKNLLFRKLHFIIAAFEILLPLPFAFIALSLAASADPTATGPPPRHRSGGPSSRQSTPMLAPLCKVDLVIPISIRGTSMDHVVAELRASFPIGRTFDSEKKLEDYASTLNFYQIEKGELPTAIVFSTNLDDVKSREGVFKYKIRFTTKPGSGCDRKEVQKKVEAALVKELTGTTTTPSYKIQVYRFPDAGVSSSAPMAASTSRSSSTSGRNLRLPSFLVTIFLAMGFIMIVPAIVKSVVNERETGIKELMKLCGIRNWMHWFAWILDSMLVLTISVTLVVLILNLSFEAPTGVRAGLIWYRSAWLWWIILWLYLLASTTFCFFISSFFSGTVVAITFGVIVWMLTATVAPIIILSSSEALSRVNYLGYALMPNTALYLAINILLDISANGGPSRDNIFKPIDSNLALFEVMIMLIVDTILYLLLTLYIEAVIPSDYGVRRPWYFLFTPSFWGCGKKTSMKVGQATVENDYALDTSGFEAEPEGLTPGVVIKDLRKSFGQHHAVDGVSMTMFDGEIFALLGHNGAGKTTTISCCIGMMAPTSGTAIINNYDIVKDIDHARQQLGVCPQHNLLFDELTVDQHLKFFGRLKGISSAEGLKERNEMLGKLQLTDKTKVKAKNLSGGQKRKLCLGIALIGRAKVVFLDEPTSGMDVEARRAIWDLLLGERGNRTIILTTHFMEEADVLGDRIAIMAHGKVQCCGTSLFLKKYYGAGYMLSVTMLDKHPEKLNNVLLIVQNHVPTARFQEDSSTADEVIIILPTDSCSTSVFSKLFKDLQDKQKSLGIRNMGLAITTMDEVFIKVDEAYSEKHVKKDQVSVVLEHQNAAQQDIVEKNNPEMNVNEVETKLEAQDPNGQSGIEAGKTEIKSPVNAHLRGPRLVVQQFVAFIIKRFKYSLRKWKLLTAQIVIPVLMLFLILLASKAMLQGILGDEPELPISKKLGFQSHHITLCHDKTTPTRLGKDDWETIVRPSAVIDYGNDSLTDVLTAASVNDAASFRKNYIVALTVNSSKILVIHQDDNEDAKYLALTVGSNTLLYLMDKKNTRLEVTDHPFPGAYNWNYIKKIYEDQFKIIVILVVLISGLLFPIGLTILAATFVVAPIEEKISKGKQLQLMTGVSPATYWSASLLFDFTVMAALSCVMICVIFIFQPRTLLTEDGGAGVFFLILLTFGYSAVILSHLFSLVVRSTSGGFAIVAAIQIVAGFSAFGLFFAEDVISRVGWSLFPSFGVTLCIMKFLYIAFSRNKCVLLPDNAEVLLCHPDVAMSGISTVDNLYQCCKKCSRLGSGKCSKDDDYISWLTGEFNVFNPRAPPGPKVKGVGQELLIMFLLGILLHVILLLVELVILPRRREIAVKGAGLGPPVYERNYDDDVEEEAQRVLQLVKEKAVDQDALVVEHFSKSYGTFAAVADVSFGVHHGECFGLLGVNGAGKTTTFRMITGDETRTSGNAYASGYNLNTSRAKFLGNIGFCPQFDGIIGVLTGLEMVQLFARLRGVKKVKQESDNWMDRVDSKNVQCRKYSGGMKRRLSAAMALVGDPEIVLMDEPTSGVDPVSRREFWKIILSTKAAGRSIILTSHSMDEIEACCTRLAIMVNGKLQCLGGVQYLKSRFAQGFSLELKLHSTPDAPDEFMDLDREITEKFAPCILKDSHATAMQYHIQDPSVPWDVLFMTMEDIKGRFPTLIEDYSIKETSLEQVFLAFARMQYPARTAPAGCCKMCG